MCTRRYRRMFSRVGSASASRVARLPSEGRLAIRYRSPPVPMCEPPITNLVTRSGYVMAATMDDCPPWEVPTKCARSMPSASMRATAVRAWTACTPSR